MPYIAREDGEHFVVPSYREAVVAKGASAVKRDIVSLSNNYGQYIAIQSKGPLRYEVAYSPDTGYLLGESIWYFLNRPFEMIYCEAIPDTTEVILVIVKEGSVYLDGRFPADGVQEELVSFLTKENQFAIYVYGNVPLSKTPEPDKFSFEEHSVKSFTVLEAPILKTLPLYKQYQLQLVEVALKAQGIGTLPVMKITIVGVLAIGLLSVIIHFSTRSAPLPTISFIDPYSSYTIALSSPAPGPEIQAFVDKMQTLFTLPGWAPTNIKYANGSFVVDVASHGSNINTLLEWAGRNHATVDLGSKNMTLSMTNVLKNRSAPRVIYPLKQIVIHFLDRLALVYPGNHVMFAAFANKGQYSTTTLTINIENFSPAAIRALSEICDMVSLVLTNISLTVNDDGLLSGSLNFAALGN